jgi:ATP phosphoribosyltransferase
VNKKLKNKNLKIAIQKDGRLTNDSLKVLKIMGIEIETYSRKLFATSYNLPIEILFCRDDDIPNYVENGTADIGIVGQNLIAETNAKVTEIAKPNFGYCSLAVAVPRESSITSIDELKDKKIATSFPNITKKYFKDKNINIKAVPISGAVEITPALGVAEAITDITVSGSSLIMNDLKQIDTIMSSEAVIIKNNKLDKSKEKLLSQLLERLKATLKAKNLKYIMMNAPEESLDKIKQIAPGLDAPTVMKLTKPNWLAIHAVIDENIFWSTTNKLKDLGAQNILVLPIEKLII